MPRRPKIPFAQELPHTYVLDEEAGVVLLRTPRTGWKVRLALGCVWEVQPVNVSVMAEADCLRVARQYENFLSGCPIGSALQAIMAIAPSTQAPAWAGQRRALAPSPLLAAQRQSIAAGLPHGTGTERGRLRAFQHLVTLRVPFTDVDPTITTVLQTLTTLSSRENVPYLRQVCAHLAAALARFAGLCAGVEDTLRSAGHPTITRLNGAAVGQALARSLRPWEIDPALAPLIVPDVALRGQVLTCDAEPMPGGFRFGTSDPTTDAFEECYRAQVVSLHHASLHTYPGMLSAPRAPEGEKALEIWKAWDGPLSVVVNLAAIDPAAEERRLSTKGTIAGFQGKWSLRNRELKKEIDGVLKDIFLAGAQMSRANIHLVLWGTGDRLQRGLDSVISATRDLGKLDFAPEPDMGSTLLLQTLPLGCDPEWPREVFLKRSRRMPRTNTMHFLPLLGGMPGTATASVLYLNDRGEAIGFDPFDGETNAHMVVMGTSGAGKTFSTADFVNDVLPLGAKAIVLDPVGNYRTLCATHDGTYITLGFRSPPRINPFFGPLDQEHQAFLAAELQEMASGGIERLTWEEFNVLSASISHFARTWDRDRGEAYLTPFVQEALGKPDRFSKDRKTWRIAEKLARQLLVFYDNGTYAGFVDGPNTFALGEHLTVIDFSELHESENLQGILFFAIMHMLAQFYKAPQHRLARKYFIADEVWALLKQQATANAIDKIIRTYRNIGVSAMFLSQKSGDFASPAGQIINTLTHTKLLLAQDSTEMKDVIRIFELTPPEVQLFEKVRKYGDFATGYLRLANGKGGLVRIISDPITNLAMGQDRVTRHRREQLLAEAGGNLQGALWRYLDQQEGMHA